MARSEVGGVEVALGLGESELVGNVGKSQHLDAGHLESGDVTSVVVDHRQQFAQVLDLFSFSLVLGEKSSSGPFVAVEYEVHEPLAGFTRGAEFDGAQAVNSRKHAFKCSTGCNVTTVSLAMHLTR